MINNTLFNIVKTSFFLLLFYFALFYTSKVALAAFNEDFNSGFTNPSLWNIVNGQGTTFSNTAINLFETSPTDFPYLYSNQDVITSSDNIVEIKFNYSDSGSNFGDGIAITDVNPPPGTTMLYPSTFSQYTMFYVWQGPGYPFLHVVSFLCDVGSPNCNNSPTIIYQTSSQDYESHTLRIERQNNIYFVYVDNVKYFESYETSRVARNIWIGHPEKTMTAGSWAKFSLDYIHIGTDGSSNTPSPSSSPSNSPSPLPSPSISPIPSPTVNPSPSGFPYYSQNDNRWGKDLYDHAQSWAQRGKEGIDRWGCALTSAAMVLKNYNVKSKYGEDTTPAVLNSWLKSQPDGYLGNGLVNWLAITRYVHESKVAGKSPTELEFIKKQYSKSNVENEIVLGKFPILGIPGHFVAAMGASDQNFLINDPANKSKLTISKADNILTSNTFTPSMTDLSYILLTYDPDMNVKLLDSRGSLITGDESEEYLSDDISGQRTRSIKLIYLPKPKSGDYTIEVTNKDDHKSTLQTYFYTKGGQVWSKKIEIHPETDTQFHFKYDNEKIQKNKLEHNWKWVWQYVKKWRRWERVWDEKIRWSIRDN